MLVPSGPFACSIQRHQGSAVMDRHDVRILDAIAVDEIFAGYSSGTKYAQRRCCAAKIRATFFYSLGNFRIRMQLDQRRWTLSLFRVRSSGACAAPAGRGSRGDFSVLNIYEPDDRLVRCAEESATFEEVGRRRIVRFLRSSGLRPEDDAQPQKIHAGALWMAHHQGMCLLSVANVLCDSSIQRRFHAEPLVAATERILHERAIVPESGDSSKAKSLLKMEALLTEGQSVLSPSYWGGKDRAETTAYSRPVRKIIRGTFFCHSFVAIFQIKISR